MQESMAAMGQAVDMRPILDQAAQLLGFKSLIGQPITPMAPQQFAGSPAPGVPAPTRPDARLSQPTAAGVA